MARNDVLDEVRDGGINAASRIGFVDRTSILRNILPPVD